MCGRYCVHMLATRHRDMEAHVESCGLGAGLELATPVLERGAWQAASALMPVSRAWLLAGAAPPLYSRPTQPPHQPAGTPLHFACRLDRLVFPNYLKGAIPSTFTGFERVILDHGWFYRE